ncbi:MULTISPECIES: MBL fold metallo-hydrolase [Sphingomonadaceae]|jgi:glyoxylase-like metal-dependent hydrolase (beta-lactamase superfamily II)|uniref:MBL fold metallo-hydrolase n=1 Tax=Sphingomonadaceae TaxID=41297 RepID=UPI000F5F9407|nr:MULTISPECIES: MBL fold metallo-hydrolase [Sphingomonadaceae]RQW39427.1 MBL fold metallo-hydrolase [Novosphingobium sp. LASN5T]RUN74656.1 MBL fold metallo-hydrolase [Sphingomonas sp. TF3]
MSAFHHLETGGSGDAALASASAQIAATSRGAAAVRAFFDPATSTISYVVHDPVTMRGAVIDSVLDYDAAAGRTSTGSAQAILDHVRAEGIAIDWLLETHAHADHLSAAPWLREAVGGQIAIGEHIREVQAVFGEIFNAGADFRRDGSDFDRLWSDGDRFAIGALPVTVLHVPGHTPACVAYVIGGAVFVGDTMFMPDYGSARADFPGGDAGTLFRSLRRILQLPGETPLFMCHDYLTEERQDHAWETTVAAQRAANIHARDGISEQEFVTRRRARDAGLAMPQLLLPSVQVNMRAGRLPPAEPNGTVYLKIPVDRL